MTLKEIAENVGVSVATVSRVINKNDVKCASREVRERIWDVVSASGYTPNKNAQNLRMSSHIDHEMVNTAPTRNIACFFGRSTDINNDPFFNAIYRSIEKEAFKLGYFIKFSLSFNQLFHPLGNDLFKNNNLDGIIILGRCKKEHLTYICNNFKNVVYVGLNTVDQPVDQIVCDGYSVAKEAVSYLHSLGHSNIGYIGEKDDEIRYRGFFDQMKELNLPINDSNCVNVPLTMEGGYNSVSKLMKSSIIPSSVFCCNDITAIGAIKAIKEVGLKIPEDISVLSIDDIEMASYIAPLLTTINIPKEEMGKMAARTLFSRINRDHKLPIKIEFPFRVQVRESCKKIAN